MDLLMKSSPQLKAPKSRLLGIGMILALLAVTTTACLEASPTDSIPSSPVLTNPPDSTIEFRDPSVPVINRGMGLPDSESGSSGTDEEVDCENAGIFATLVHGHVMTSPTIAISDRMMVQNCPKIGTGTDDYP
jgi:hypothetical protein